MSVNTRIESMLDAMTKEELRAALLEALNESKAFRDRFIAEHSEPDADAEDPVLLGMAREKAEAIAAQIASNLADGNMEAIARKRHRARYLEVPEAYGYAVEDELDEAVAYAKELAGSGHVRLAVEFARIADPLVFAALNHPDYDPDWVDYSICLFWEGILEGTAGAVREKALEFLLQEVEAMKEPGQRPCFLLKYAGPVMAERLLRLLDRQIEAKKETEAFRQSRVIPPVVYYRTRAMKELGMTRREIDDYIDSAFGDFAFGLKRRLDRAEAEHDAKAIANACRALLAFDLPSWEKERIMAKLNKYGAALN